MKVETKPIEQKPEIVITLSWEEASVMRTVCGGIGGGSQNRYFMSSLWRELSDRGVPAHPEFEFSGNFSKRP